MGRSFGFDWSKDGRRDRILALHGQGRNHHQIAVQVSREWGADISQAQVQGALRIARRSRSNNSPRPEPLDSEPIELTDADLVSEDTIETPPLTEEQLHGAPQTQGTEIHSGGLPGSGAR